MGRLIDVDSLILEQQSLEDVGQGIMEFYSKEQIDNAETVGAIPKDQYEARLKADMVAMLTEIQLEIEESENCGKAFHLGLQMASNIIQQRIDKLEENTGGTNTD